MGDNKVIVTTKDGKEISVEGSILFRIDKHNAPELWENLGENVVSKVVRPFSRSKIAGLFSDLTLDQIKQHRSQVESIVKDELNKYFKDRGLDCEGFLLSSVQLVKSKGHEVVIENSKVD